MSLQGRWPCVAAAPAARAMEQWMPVAHTSRTRRTTRGHVPRNGGGRSGPLAASFRHTSSSTGVGFPDPPPPLFPKPNSPPSGTPPPPPNSQIHPFRATKRRSTRTGPSLHRPLHKARPTTAESVSGVDDDGTMAIMQEWGWVLEPRHVDIDAIDVPMDMAHLDIPSAMAPTRPGLSAARLSTVLETPSDSSKAQAVVVLQLPQQTGHVPPVSLLFAGRPLHMGRSASTEDSSVGKDGSNPMDMLLEASPVKAPHREGRLGGFAAALDLPRTLEQAVAANLPSVPKSVSDVFTNSLSAVAKPTISVAWMVAGQTPGTERVEILRSFAAFSAVDVLLLRGSIEHHLCTTMARLEVDRGSVANHLQAASLDDLRQLLRHPDTMTNPRSAAGASGARIAPATSCHHTSALWHRDFAGFQHLCHTAGVEQPVVGEQSATAPVPPIRPTIAAPLTEPVMAVDPAVEQPGLSQIHHELSALFRLPMQMTVDEQTALLQVHDELSVFLDLPTHRSMDEQPVSLRLRDQSSAALDEQPALLRIHDELSSFMDLSAAKTDVEKTVLLQLHDELAAFLELPAKQFAEHHDALRVAADCTVEASGVDLGARPAQQQLEQGFQPLLLTSSPGEKVILIDQGQPSMALLSPAKQPAGLLGSRAPQVLLEQQCAPVVSLQPPPRAALLLGEPQPPLAALSVPASALWSSGQPAGDHRLPSFTLFSEPAGTPWFEQPHGHEQAEHPRGLFSLSELLDDKEQLFQVSPAGVYQPRARAEPLATGITEVDKHLVALNSSRVVAVPPVLLPPRPLAVLTAPEPLEEPEDAPTSDATLPVTTAAMSTMAVPPSLAFPVPPAQRTRNGTDTRFLWVCAAATAAVVFAWSDRTALEQKVKHLEEELHRSVRQKVFEAQHVVEVIDGRVTDAHALLEPLKPQAPVRAARRPSWLGLWPWLSGWRMQWIPEEQRPRLNGYRAPLHVRSGATPGRVVPSSSNSTGMINSFAQPAPPATSSTAAVAVYHERVRRMQAEGIMMTRQRGCSSAEAVPLFVPWASSPAQRAQELTLSLLPLSDGPVEGLAARWELHMAVTAAAATVSLWEGRAGGKSVQRYLALPFLIPDEDQRVRVVPQPPSPQQLQQQRGPVAVAIPRAVLLPRRDAPGRLVSVRQSLGRRLSARPRAASGGGSGGSSSSSCVSSGMQSSSSVHTVSSGMQSTSSVHTVSSGRGSGRGSEGEAFDDTDEGVVLLPADDDMVAIGRCWSRCCAGDASWAHVLDPALPTADELSARKLGSSAKDQPTSFVDDTCGDVGGCMDGWELVESYDEANEREAVGGGPFRGRTASSCGGTPHLPSRA